MSVAIVAIDLSITLFSNVWPMAIAAVTLHFSVVLRLD
jgi:hypothetical protein